MLLIMNNDLYEAKISRIEISEESLNRLRNIFLLTDLTGIFNRYALISNNKMSW